MIDVINIFREENLNPMHVEALLIDNMDYMISFGQTNNVKRFMGYLNFKNPNFYKENLTVLVTTEDHFEEINDIKKIVN